MTILLVLLIQGFRHMIPYAALKQGDIDGKS